MTNTTQHNANNAKRRGIPAPLQQFAAFWILLAVSPLMLITYCLIKLESRGPAMFTQTRVGKLGERFEIYKFRSMYLKTDPRYREPDASTSDREGACKKYFNDPRISAVGRVIRKLSIDELPQLFNVLKGQMLLIGPRPALPCEVDTYQLNNYRRLDSEPGLTGLWQVSGRANTSFEEQLDLDIRYVDNQSLGLDLKILAATVPAVLSGEGAY